VKSGQFSQLFLADSTRLTGVTEIFGEHESS
jgi:hypothetical protein